MLTQEQQVRELETECTRRACEANELRGKLNAAERELAANADLLKAADDRAKALAAELSGLKAMEAATRMERDQAQAELDALRLAAVHADRETEAFVSRDLVQRALEALGDERRGPLGRARVLLEEALGR